MANPSLQIGNSNWAIKEDNLLGYSTAGTRFVPQPITMTRASAGTRVNSSGLVETVELLGSEDVRDGNFPTPNTEWGTAAGWTIADNKATSAGANEDAYLTQSNMVLGKTYKVTFDVDDYTSGALSVRVFGQSQVLAVTSTGSYIVYLTPVSTTVLGFRSAGGAGGYVGSVSNISVKESTKNNLARVDYDGTASSLLVEPERTNTLLYSEDFSQWLYFGTAPTLTTGQLAPDGTYNATKVSGVIGSTNLYRNSESSTTASRSIYARTVSGTGTAKLTSHNSNTNNLFTLTEDWQRFELTGSSAIGGTNFYAADFRDTSQTLSEFIIWGCQSEEGSYPTSYIPTDGGTVTRVQDQYSKTGISNLINSEEGVLFVEMAALDSSGTYRLISLSDGTDNNRLFIGLDTATGYIYYYVIVGGVVKANFTTSIFPSAFTKVAVKYKENDFALWINGVEVSTDSGGTTFPIGTLDRLKFESGNAGTVPFYGKVKQLQVFKTALTDSELIALTTI